MIRVVNLILEVYKDFGLKNYKFRLSLRDPLDKEKYFDDDEMWNTAENKLREVLNELGVEYIEAIGEKFLDSESGEIISIYGGPDITGDVVGYTDDGRMIKDNAKNLELAQIKDTKSDTEKLSEI